MQVHKLKDQQRRSRPGGSESALFAGAGHVQVQQGQGGTLCGYGEGKVKKKKKKKKKKSKNNPRNYSFIDVAHALSCIEKLYNCPVCEG